MADPGTYCEMTYRMGNPNASGNWISPYRGRRVGSASATRATRVRVRAVAVPALRPAASAMDGISGLDFRPAARAVIDVEEDLTYGQCSPGSCAKRASEPPSLLAIWRT
jgi:hypothetical protein